jgi:hypothetical protein
MRPHIDDEIFRVREFMNELSKVQDNYYNELEKRLLEDPLYSVEKVKELIEELIGGPSDLINDEKDLREWFWDYMYNGDEEKDFIDYLIDYQTQRNEYLKEHYQR